jgi:hypothetical protein
MRSGASGAATWQRDNLEKGRNCGNASFSSRGKTKVEDDPSSYLSRYIAPATDKRVFTGAALMAVIYAAQLNFE